MLRIYVNFFKIKDYIFELRCGLQQKLNKLKNEIDRKYTYINRGRWTH